VAKLHQTLPITTARSSSDGVAMSYVLPVLWMASCFYTMWPESSTALCLEEFRQVAVLVGRQTTTVFGRVNKNAAPGAQSVIYD